MKNPGHACQPGHDGVSPGHDGVSPAHPASLQANFFDEYQMEGVSSEDNEICLEVAPDNLSRALKTIQNAKSMKVKLTKKHCPCLTVAAELVSLETAE